MAVTPEDLLEQARGFSLSNEPAVRVAVNRAYYAAFHAASQFHERLTLPGYSPPNACGVHETLYHRLVNPTLKSSDQRYIRSKQIGLIARDIKSKRRLADYELKVPVTSDVADYVITQASKILQLARE